MLGCFGNFLPFDRGLSAISNGTSWPIQGSILTAVVYHLQVNDQIGFVGKSFRLIVGSYNETDTRIILVTIHLITNLLHTFFSNDANLFTPIHKFLYLIFQVQGPIGQHQIKAREATVGWNYHTRIYLERIIELSRLIAVIAVIMGHIYITQIPTTIVENKLFQFNEKIGSCQLFNTFQNCKPYIFTLETIPTTAGSKDTNVVPRLAVYETKLKELTNNSNLNTNWNLNLKLNKSKNNNNNSNVLKGLIISNDGILRYIQRSLTNEQDEVLWTSNVNNKCKIFKSENENNITIKTFQSLVYLFIQNDGIPAIHCPDGTTFPVVL